MWVKVEGKVTPLGDMLAVNRSILWLDNIDISIPALIPLWKQQGIMQRGIKWVQVSDLS